MLKIPTKKQNLPAFKNASICGAIIKANNETGLANSINQIIIGGNLNNKIFKN